MDNHTRVNGLMTNPTVRELINGKIKVYISEIFSKESNINKENLHGLIKQAMMGNGGMILSMEEEIWHL